MNEHPRNVLIVLPHAVIVPGGRNPRTRFDAGKHEEMKANLRARGFDPGISHLLVRPHPVYSDKYEIVCGERRWRGAGELIAEGKLTPEVPAFIKEMGDGEMLEIQMIENLQRDDLTPLDEAQGLRMMLDLIDEGGKPVHTIKSLAQKIGRSEMHVHGRLAICKLRGTTAGEALEAGELTLAHATALARVPAGQLRDDLTRRVLKPADGLGTMPYRQLERTIREECMVELRSTRFDPADPALVEVVFEAGERAMGGACGDCPYNTKNAAADERGSKLHMCMNPECFRLKTARAHERWMAGVTDEAKGRAALTVEEAEKVFDFTGKKLGPYGGFVELDAVPDETDLKRGVKDAGPWKKLVRGQGVPVVLAKDADGKVHELVKRDLALAAARQNEAEKPAAERVFKAEARSAAAVESKGSADEEQARRQADLAMRLREKRIGDAQLRALVFGARVNAAPDGFWPLAIEALIACVDEHGDAPDVALRQGFPDDQDLNGTADWLRKLGKTTGDVSVQIGLAVDLILTLLVPPERMEALPAWAKVFGVDLKAVRKQVEGDIATEEKAAAVQAKAVSEVSEVLTWDKFKTEISDFDWNEHQVAESPDVILLKFAKSSKLSGSVGVARNERGWHCGARIKGSDWGSSAPCSANGPNYATRELAVKAALLTILQSLLKQSVSGAALDHVNRLIDLVSASGGEPETASAKPKRK